MATMAFVRIFDEENKHWSKNETHNEFFIHATSGYLNDLLSSRGHVFLNEVYDVLGFERTAEGAVYGWFKTDSSGPIEFGIEKSGPAMRLTFWPHGVIYSRLPTEFSITGTSRAAGV